MSTFKEQGIDSYPLAWPVGWARERYRKRSKFKVTSFERARTKLFKELKLLGVGDWNIVLSTNLPLRRDGMPYSGMANPADPGVAVYFRIKDKPLVFACDQYISAIDNLYAIAMTIEALRGIERWGASDMMERSFTGFTALPPPQSSQPTKEWWDVLELKRDAPKDMVKERYRLLAQIYHPDKPGGSQTKMAELNAAYEKGMKS